MRRRQSGGKDFNRKGTRRIICKPIYEALGKPCLSSRQEIGPIGDYLSFGGLAFKEDFKDGLNGHDALPRSSFAALEFYPAFIEPVQHTNPRSLVAWIFHSRFKMPTEWPVGPGFRRAILPTVPRLGRSLALPGCDMSGRDATPFANSHSNPEGISSQSLGLAQGANPRIQQRVPSTLKAQRFQR